jgi:hypothetical protein
LSTQTQLASLRGALEAARLREEKHKAEMEKYTKELDTLRWENMNSRRGEVEVGTLPFSLIFASSLDMLATLIVNYRVSRVYIYISFPLL